MLHNIKRLYGNGLRASDDKAGRLVDCYFDDENWTVRYFVLDTDWWTFPRRLLLSPHAFGPIPEHGKTLSVHLTREQIEQSPTLDWQGPITREFETNYYRYYGWPCYWQGGCLWGPGDFPTQKPSLEQGRQCQASAQPGGDDRQPAEANTHLRSAQAFLGLPAYSGGDSIGRVADFIVDERNWRIRYLALDVGHWYARKEVLISTRKILSIDWNNCRVNVTPTKEAIAHAASRPVVHGCAAACEPAIPVS